MVKHSRPELILISVSGAHATGKTTLLERLGAELASRGEAHVIVPSFSSELFRSWRSGKLRNAPFPVANYDEIDKRGHREWFQDRLPDALCSSVEAASIPLRKRRCRVYVLMDRWFVDIMAHTRIGITDAHADVVHRRLRDRCVDLAELLIRGLRAHFLVTHIPAFIPISACPFTASGQDDKFRATVDRSVFETVCLDEWDKMFPSIPLFYVRSESVSDRVASVLNDTRVSVSHGK